ncbi:MAG TPA: AI-2E family transporter [Ardenticatenaceae bacterium]|nr:AI-2E family transporter [Ardenticatenaceae bacterium]
MSHTWTPRVKQWVALGLIGLGILILRLLWQYLTPLALALLLTFILNPVVNFVERRTEWPRVGATGFVYLILILLLLLIPLTVAPIVVAQLTSLAVNFADVQEGLLAWVNSLEPFRIGTLVVRPVRWVDPVLLQLESLLPNLVPTSVDLFFGVATTFVASLFWLVFILVISFYLVRDAAAVRAYLLGLVPPAYMNDATVLIGRINSIWHSFLRGQVVLSIVIGTAVTLALLILGVPNALLLGLLAGILEMIPNVGPFIAMVPALLIALFNGSTNWELSNGLFALLVIGTYTLIQQVENNYLVPRIIGRSVHLHPVVILLGAIAGASIGGILGIFLAAPVLASLRVLAGYAYWKLLEPEESEALPARTELNDVPVPNVSSAHVSGVKQRPLPPEAVTPEPLALDT